MRNLTTAPCLMHDAQGLFPNLVVYGAEHVHLGARVSFNHFCHLTAVADAPIFIGDDVLFGPFVLANTGDHGFASRTLKVRDQAPRRERIVIGNDVWIGGRVTLLRGAVVPDGCIIGACSLVTRHDALRPYGVYAGSPLRRIGERT